MIDSNLIAFNLIAFKFIDYNLLYFNLMKIIIINIRSPLFKVDDRSSYICYLGIIFIYYCDMIDRDLGISLSL